MSWYALEKLADAAAVVENGGASVRARLFRAFHHLHRVRPEDMPDGDLHRAFDIMVALTTEEAQGSEGRLVATLRSWTTRTPRTSPVASSTCVTR